MRSWNPWARRSVARGESALRHQVIHRSVRAHRARGWDQTEGFDQARALVAATFRAEVTVFSNVIALEPRPPERGGGRHDENYTLSARGDQQRGARHSHAHHWNVRSPPDEVVVT
jgi:hypothetical protein